MVYSGPSIKYFKNRGDKSLDLLFHWFFRNNKRMVGETGYAFSQTSFNKSVCTDKIRDGSEKETARWRGKEGSKKPLSKAEGYLSLTRALKSPCILI